MTCVDLFLLFLFYLFLIDLPRLRETLRHLVVVLILTDNALNQIYDFVTTVC